MTSVDDGAKETPTPYPTVWGQPISPEWQAQLQGMLDTWRAPDADHSDQRSSFDGVLLIGADVAWLAQQRGHGQLPSGDPLCQSSSAYHGDP
jgi:hypothetical protein